MGPPPTPNTRSTECLEDTTSAGRLEELQVSVQHQVQVMEDGACTSRA